MEGENNIQGNPEDASKNSLQTCHQHEVGHALQMNPGDGQNSYTQNSGVQKQVICKARSVLESAMKDIFSKDFPFPKCFVVADLGCASGPQSLVATSEIIDCLASICQQVGHRPPDLQVFLNDLPWNDFNFIFSALPTFYEKLKQEKGDRIGSCYFAGNPGSFFGRLFPDKSLHLVHSSCSLHWLSQVPEGIENNGNIYIAKSSSDSVIKLYHEQFEKDFFNFLRSRAEEVVPGGKMVLTLTGRTAIDPTDDDCCLMSGMLAKSLLEIAAEGLVNVADVDTFNLPFYTASPIEIRETVENETSFIIDHLQVFPLNWDHDIDGKEDYVFNKSKSGRKIAGHVRAITESMLVSHFGFGDATVDKIFKKYAEFAGENMSKGNKTITHIILSMTRK